MNIDNPLRSQSEGAVSMQIHGPNGESSIRTDPASSGKIPGTLHSVSASEDSNEASTSVRRTRSSQIADLRALIRDMPEIREDVIQEIATRLNSGEYDTKDSARKTAQSLIDML